MFESLNNKHVPLNTVMPHFNDDEIMFNNRGINLHQDEENNI